MDASLIKVIEQCAQNSLDGTGTFGEAVRTLMSVNVESYHADYRNKDTTYYLPDGAAHLVKLPVPSLVIPQEFNGAALQAAIRAAQRDEVRYPEFLKLSMQAGCVGYMVWIAGRHVSYFGHRGEVHVEQFPSSPKTDV
jgi:uncharacterized protein YbcV (DUF1398 family)